MKHFRLLMRPKEIDQAVRLGVLAFVVGGIAWLVGFPISTFFLGGVGAMTGTFAAWRTDNGLWMLGGFFLTFFGSIYVVLTYSQLTDLFAARVGIQFSQTMDWLIGTAVLNYKIRFLWSVSNWNKKLAKIV